MSSPIPLCVESKQIQPNTSVLIAFIAVMMSVVPGVATAAAKNDQVAGANGAFASAVARDGYSRYQFSRYAGGYDNSEINSVNAPPLDETGPHPEEVRLIWTNDTHGFFMPLYHAEPSNIDRYAGIAATEGKLGGYAQIATLVKQYKPQRQNALFLDSGDTFDGSPSAQISKGAAVIPILNKMGYDAWVPGNRDFGFGKEVFLENVGNIQYPTVGTTLHYAPSDPSNPQATCGPLVFPPYIIKQLPTKRVMLIGLVHPLVTDGFALGDQCAPSGSPDGFEVAGEVSALIAQVRAQQAAAGTPVDIVVAMSHFGKDQDLKFATEQAGINVILGGHSHDVFEKPSVMYGADGHPVTVVQAGSHGVYLGILDMKIDQRGDITIAGYGVKRIISDQVTPDPEILSLSQAAYAPYKAYFEEQIGYTSTTVYRRGAVQSNMANLLCDAYAKMWAADLCHFRGIRYGATLIPGPVTVGDVWNMVSPNWGGNKVYAGAVPGKVVYNMVNNWLNMRFGTDPYQWPGGDAMRWNANVRYEYIEDAPQDQHLVSLRVGDDYLYRKGAVVQDNMEKMYTYASTTPNPAQPQTGTPVYATDEQREFEAVDEIIDYIKAEQVVSPTLDRRTVQVFAGPLGHR